MDYLFIEKCREEVEEKLLRERILNVYVNNRSVSLKFKNQFLNLYTGQPNALFFANFSIAKLENPKFKAVEGNFVKAVRAPVVDRVIEIETVKLFPSGKRENYYLILELTGMNANIFLLNGEKKIISTLREVKSSLRTLKKGAPYTFPPQEKKEFHQLSFGKITQEGIEKKLYKFVAGISPLNAKELARLFKNSENLEKAYEEFMDKNKTSHSAYLYYENGKPKYLTTFLYQSLKNLKFKEFSGRLPYTECWKTYYLEKVKKGETESLKRKLIKGVERKIEKVKEELQNLKSREELLREAEENRKRGEILKYNLNSVKAGTKSIKALDYSTNQKVEIPLNPSFSPQENVKKYFSKYRKLKRTAEYEETLRQNLEEELLELKFLKESIKRTDNLEELKNIIPTKKKRKREREREKKHFKVYTLPSGRQLIVGRSSKENEFISLKLANPQDIWFHAKSIPGSHVLLRLKENEKPTNEDIFLAAAAAAYFSKGKQSGKVPVDYTEAKKIKKPKGTPPGFVVYESEKTVFVNPDLFSSFTKELKKGKEKVD